MVNNTFQSVIERYRQGKSKLILALSGGLDSRVMLHALARFQQQFPDVEVCAVHVHHGLSQYADQWLEACQKWCAECGVDFYFEHASLDLNSKQSLEAQARDARYTLLEKYVGQGDLLLTAQHADDQLETMLLALKRGSGPRGLAAMGECSSYARGQLVRPFLGLKRTELEAYANEHALQWVEDESNQNTDFDRNFLRHTIVPELSQRWPHIQASAVRSARLCFEQEQLLDELLEDKFLLALNSSKSLNINVLLSVSPPVRNRLIRRWFGLFQLPMPSQKQLSLIHREVILAAADAMPKLVVGTHSVRRFQNALFLVAADRDLKSWQSDLSIGIEKKLPSPLGSVVLSDAKLSEHGLLVKAPQADDRVWIQFNPSGLTLHPETRSGSRKLKKLFQEYQIPPWIRSQIPILMYNHDVVAVGDLFVCKAFSDNTYRFHWVKEE